MERHADRFDFLVGSHDHIPRRAGGIHVGGRDSNNLQFELAGEELHFRIPEDLGPEIQPKL